MKRALQCAMVVAFASSVAIGSTVTIDPPALPIQAGTEITVTFDPTCGPLAGKSTIYMEYGINDFNLTGNVLMNSTGAAFVATLGVPLQAEVVNIYFRDDGDPYTYDSNNGGNYNYPADGVESTPRVTFSPDPIVAGTPVTVTYDPAGTILQGADEIYMHYGYNGWSPTADPDVLLTTNGVGGFEVTVPVGTYVYELNLAFNDTGNPADPLANWDDNDDFDWNIAVSGTIPVVEVSPAIPVVGEPVEVCYNPTDRPIQDTSTTGEYYLHWGINGFEEVYDESNPFIQMSTNGMGQYCVTIPSVPVRATRIQVVFRDRAGDIGDPDAIWDSNDSNNWSFDTVGAKPFTNELDALYVGWSYHATYEDMLNIGIAGGLQDNGSAFVIFIDTPNFTGQTEFQAAGLASVPDNLKTASVREDLTLCDTVGEGTILPHEFDYALYVNHAGPNVYFNELQLSGSFSAGSRDCCGGGTLPIYVSEEYIGATSVNTGNSILDEDFPDDYGYLAGYFDTDTNSVPGVGTAGLEVAIPLSRIGALGLGSSDDLTIWVGMMPNVGGVQGQFSSQMLPSSTNGLSYNVADFDQNCVVDITDFEAWFECLSGPGGDMGSIASCAVDADFDNDGDADLADFASLTRVYNQGDVCEPISVLPLRADLNDFVTGVWSGNVATLPTFSGSLQGNPDLVDGIIDPANYGGAPIAVQGRQAVPATGDSPVFTGGLVGGATVDVYYNPNGRPLAAVDEVSMNYAFNDTNLTSPTTVPMMINPCNDQEWMATIYIDTSGVTPLELDLSFQSSNGAMVDDNLGQFWQYEIARKASGEAVVLDPVLPQSGGQVTVTYNPAGRVLEGASAVSMHYGFNGWQFGITDVALDPVPNECKWSTTIDVSEIASGTNGLAMVFFEPGGSWDNNDGNDWFFEVEFVGQEPPFTMDGQLDAQATLIGTSTNGLRHLYLAQSNGWLYVATESTVGSVDDHFIFIAANEPNVQATQPWGKAPGSTVGAWDLYIAQEADNEWLGWFDVDGVAIAAPPNTNNPYLEGAVDLASEFGTPLPTTIYVAHGAWATAGGGVLKPAYQIRKSEEAIPDGNLDGTSNPDGPSEFLQVDISGATPVVINP